MSKNEKENPIKILKRKKERGKFFIELFELKNPTSAMRWKQQQATASSELLYFYLIFFRGRLPFIQPTEKML